MTGDLNKIPDFDSGESLKPRMPLSIKSIATVLVATVLGAGGYAKRDDIGDAMTDSLRHLTHIQFMGLQADFSSESIDKTVRPDLFARLDGPDKSKVARAAADMTDADVVRLLNVGLLENLCDYELATTQMTQDFETDKRLRDKGFVHIVEDEKLKSELLRKAKSHRDKPSDIGHPVTCYSMVLTDRGRDVRTALTYAYAAAFAKNQSAAGLTAQSETIRAVAR
jgi:hypothetical protein